MSTEGPKISIITVVKDEVEGIEKTIQSVHALSWPHIEHIVIDGSECEVNKRELQKLCASVDVLCSERDNGVYDAMNKGLSLCHGQWVHFLNAGDVYLVENAIEQLVPYMEDSCDFVYSDVNREYQDQTRELWRQRPPIQYGLFNNICHQGIWYNLTKHPDLKYNCHYSISADCHLLLSLIFRSPNFKCQYVDQPLTTFKLGGLSQKYALQALRERERSFNQFMDKDWQYYLNMLNLKRQIFKCELKR